MKIEEYKFGSFVIDGRQFLDNVKIIDGRIMTWHPSERHLLKLVDIKDLIESKPEIIIVGMGASGLMEVSLEVRDDLMKKRITLYADKTEKMCKLFNELKPKEKKVAAIFHATC